MHNTSPRRFALIACTYLSLTLAPAQNLAPARHHESRPPVANAGHAATAHIGRPVTLDGTASTSVDGIAKLTYRWTVNRPDGSAVDVANSTSPIASFTPDLAGDYQISLTVANGFASSTATSIVSTRNSVPIANAGLNRTVKTGALVLLRGNHSSDPDGDSLTYRWTLTELPQGSRATLVSPNSLSPAFLADRPGNYTAQLIVNDGQSDSLPSSVTISTLRTAPRANAGSNQIVSVGDLVELNGAGSTNWDGAVLSYHWALIAAPAGSSAELSDANAISPTFTIDTPGTYVAQLIVRDDFLESAPANVVLTTNSILPPVANAGLNKTVSTGNTLNASGSAIDPQGLPLTYHWALIAKPAGSAASLSTPDSANPALVVDTPGDYVAQLIVDNGIRTSVPSTVTITTSNTPPNANTGVSQNVLTGASVTLDSTHSSGVSYRWSMLSAPSGSFATLALADSATPTFVADVAGTYVVQLITNDGNLDSLNPATVTVTAADSTEITLSPNQLSLTPEGTGLLSVRLPFSAGADGHEINLVSSNGDAVITPSTIRIAPGAHAANIPVTSGSIGTANLSATAPGFEPATAGIQVSADSRARSRQALLLRSKLQVAQDHSATFPVNLSKPAPAGGLTIHLTSSNSAVATVSPSTVMIQAGATAPAVHPLVNGLTKGSAVILGRAASSTRNARSLEAFTKVSIGTASALTITTTSLPDATLNKPYSQMLSVAGGTPPYTWSNPGGQLPSGLSIDPSTGIISGTPTGSPPADGSGLIVFISAVDLAVKDASSQSAKATLVLTVLASGADTKGPLVFVTGTLPSGAVGLLYAQPLVAAGGKPPYNYAILDGSLPNGLTLDPLSGLISGTPTAVGNPRLGFIVTDSATPTAASASTSLRVTILSAPPQITTAALPTGYALAPYAFPLTGAGGTPPYTWSATGLPNGLTISSAGVISGTPSSIGMSFVTITLTDAANLSAMKILPISIGLGALSITTTSLQTGQVNVPYSQSLSAVGGTTPYMWSASGLPAGLTISPSGVISGTPLSMGTSNVSITVTDATSPAHMMASTSLQLTVTNQQTSPLVITTVSLPSGTINVPYSATVSATGGMPSYTWSATGLPSGLSINATTGVISGTPVVSGPFMPSIMVMDASHQPAAANISLIIGGPSLVILSTSLPVGVAGMPYSATLMLTGGIPPYTWSAPGLPAGLVLNPTSGVISGTPSSPVTNLSVKITVTDSGQPPQNASTTLPLTINPQMAGAPLTITMPTPLPNAYVGVPYDVFLQASGGTPPYTWSSVRGRLSPGLALGSNGEISGTPPGPGVFDGLFAVIYQVMDATGQTATKYLELNVLLPTLAFTTPSILSNGSLGVPYSQKLATIFGTAPLTFTMINGALPPGLNLNSSTGVISGTPTGPGSTTAVIKVTDSSTPFQLDIRGFAITITAGPVITTNFLPNGQVSTPYSLTVNATGGSTPYTWSATALPAGLSIDPNTGTISGTPTAPGTSTAIITVKEASPSHLTASVNLSITITPSTQLAITTASLAPGNVNVPYFASLSATGGTTPYSWGATGLPAGLSVNPMTGAINGTPTAPGTSTVMLSVTDFASHVATASLPLTISSAPPLTITTTSLPNGVTNSGYFATLTAAGGTPTYTWSASGLPNGLFINPGTGTINGTPTAIGTSQVMVTVTDASHITATANLSLTIGGGALTITTTALMTGRLGVDYSQTMTAAGGQPPYTWKVASGRLYPGLVLNSSTGVISGTPTGRAPADGNGTIASDSTVTFLVTDSNSQTATKSLELLILGP